MSAIGIHEAEDKQSVSEAAVRAQLNRVLNEHPLRSSTRCQKFLTFIVEKTLQGEGRDIKERFIGVEVFGRPLDYDPANDPVVRLVAGETRKRIAQYYVQKEHEHELRIEVLPGTYVPTFHWPLTEHASPTPAESGPTSSQQLTELAPTTPVARSGQEPQSPAKSVEPAATASWASRKLFSGTVAAAILLLVFVAFWLFWIHTSPSRALRELWRPIVDSGSSTLICIGDLNNSLNPSLNDNDSLQQIQLTRNHVGPYDVAALARLAGMLGGMGRSFTVTLADNTNFTDLRAQPAILIGAFDNQWTSLLLSERRFQFHNDLTTGTVFLIDSKNPQKLDWSLNVHQPMRAITHDTGLISRIVSRKTGRAELLIAGIGPYGTSAASEYVTNPDYFKEFTDRAPNDWKNRDIQIVITTDVVNGRSGPPHMVVFDVR